MDLTQTNSTELIKIIKERFDNLEHKNFDYKSFQNGFLECFAEWVGENNKYKKQLYKKYRIVPFVDTNLIGHPVINYIIEKKSYFFSWTQFNNYTFDSIEKAQKYIDLRTKLENNEL
jgi:hypothetical protein